MRKELLVLAKSFKQGGFCVAGLEVSRNQQGQRVLQSNWIRPVLSSPAQCKSAALPLGSCENFRVFDTVSFEMQGYQPSAGQQENWQWAGTPTINAGIECPPHLLHELAANSGLIWFDSTTTCDNQVSGFYADHTGRQDSVMLIQPQNLIFCLEVKNNNDKLKRCITAEFTHLGYRFGGISVTDPWVHRIFSSQFPQQVGYKVRAPLALGDQCWLTLSLTLPFGSKGLRYLLVAAVIDHTLTFNRRYS